MAYIHGKDKYNLIIVININEEDYCKLCFLANIQWSNLLFHLYNIHEERNMEFGEGKLITLSEVNVYAYGVTHAFLLI